MPGLMALAHGGDRGFGAGHADLQALDLFRRLHRAHGEDLALAILDLQAALLQRQGLEVAAAVHADLGRAAAMGAHQLGDLIGERAGGLVVAAGDRGPDQLAGPHLVHGVDHGADVIALRIVEQDDRAADRHEEIARRVAQEIAEHVARAGGVALVVRVEQDHAAIAGAAPSRRAASRGGRRAASWCRPPAARCPTATCRSRCRRSADAASGR